MNFENIKEIKQHIGENRMELMKKKVLQGLKKKDHRMTFNSIALLFEIHGVTELDEVNMIIDDWGIREDLKDEDEVPELNDDEFIERNY